MKILILGCGPAGLFAAHAASTAGHSVAIVSKKRQSELFGAQYLHQPIPGLSNPEFLNVRYEMRGDPRMYAFKIYGPSYTGSVSPEELEQDHAAWDIRATYSRAWELYSHMITDAIVDGGSFLEARQQLRPDLVINTLPAPVLCMVTGHRFISQTVFASGDAPERGQACPVRVDPETVVCNGEAMPRWYRASNVFGYSTCEWPDGKKPPFEGVAKISKPLRTTCDCFLNEQGYVRMGRYGRWQKGVLSHEAYFETKAML